MKPMISLATLLSLVVLAAGQTSSPPGIKPPIDTRPPIETQSSSGLATGKSGTGAGKTSTARPARSGLEKALEEALKNNPDLRVAAAKAGEAEAVLARARLQVTQKVVTTYQTAELARATADLAQKQLRRMRDLKSKIANAVSQDDVTRAEAELSAARAKVATAEAELDYLLGKSAMRTTGLNLNYLPTSTTISPVTTPNPYTLGLYERGLGGSSLGVPSNYYSYIRQPAGTSTVRGDAIPSSDKLRTILDRRISVKFTDTPASEALKILSKEAQGMHIQASLKEDVWKEKVSATLTDVPFGAALQLLEDTLTDHRIVVRGYGLLVARKEHVPAGGVLLDDFRQLGIEREAAVAALRIGKPGTEANPPAAKVEGTVTRIGEGGLVTVSVGSDAGVAKGNTLEVFRLGTAPRYLGRLRIVDVTAKQAVGQQIAGAMKEAIKSGDRVASEVTRTK